MKVDQITIENVELAPKQLVAGRLYVSEKYSVALHLCCCGCGEKVVTPLSPAEWRIDVRQGRASLFPSIGNWSMACKSHYWIRNGQVVWGAGMSKRQMRAVFDRDQQALRTLHRTTGGHQVKSPTRAPALWLSRLWRKLFS